MFIEFMLTALRDACLQVANSDQVSDYVSDQVKAVLNVFCPTIHGHMMMKSDFDFLSELCAFA